MKFEIHKPHNFTVASPVTDFGGNVPEYLCLPKCDIAEWAKRYTDYLDTSITQEVCKCEWVAHPEDLEITPLCCRTCRHPREKHGANGLCSVTIKTDDAIDGTRECECTSYSPRRVRMGDLNEHCPVHTPVGRIMGFFEFVFGVSETLENKSTSDVVLDSTSGNLVDSNQFKVREKWCRTPGCDHDPDNTHCVNSEGQISEA